MLKRPALLLAAAALFALSLSGCTVSASLTVSPEKLATTAADALEAQIGERPEVQCGTENIAVVDGATTDCTVTDPLTGLEFDAVVTISDIEGTNFRVSVDVADAPNNAQEPGMQQPDASDDPEDKTVGTLGADGSVLVYDYELAAMAADALTGSYGARPTIICQEDPAQFTIAVGMAIECKLIEAKTGARGVATITVTSIDRADFNIDVNVVDP